MRLLRFGRPSKEPRHQLTDELARLKVELATRTGERDSLHGQVALKQAEIVALLATNDQWEAAYAELEKRHDEAVRCAADLAAENVLQVDRARVAEAAFSDVREQLRQAQRAQARAEQQAAEHAVTIDGLGLAMAELERKAERRDFLDDDRRHVRLADGQGDQ